MALGQHTHHQLITKTTRSFQTIASAVFSSVSSHFASSAGSGRPEQKQQDNPPHHLRLQGKTFALEDEIWAPIAGPSSCVEDDDPQFTDGCAGSYELGNSVRYSPWVSAFIIGGRNPPSRSSQLHHWGSRQYTQSSRRSLQEHEIYQGRLRVKESSTIRIWHIPKRFHMGHAHHHDHDPSGKANERVLGLGLWSDIGLAIGKGGAGYVSGSQALIADAVHSVSDIALSGVALLTSKVAHAPSDKQHPYGHGKFESLGALGISGMLLLTGGGIGWHAVETLQPFIPMMSEWVQTSIGHSHEHEHGEGHHHGIDLQHPYVALTAAVVSIGVKEMLYHRTKRIGEQQSSELLKASAWHHRSDAVSSIVALVGIGGAILGMPLLDPVAGFVVSGMIVKAGFETGYSSLQDLVDSGVKESVLSPIRNTVLEVEGVEVR